MTVEAVCPRCDSRMVVPPELVGERVSCPACQEVFEVPPPFAEVVEAPAPKPKPVVAKPVVAKPIPPKPAPVKPVVAKPVAPPPIPVATPPKPKEVRWSEVEGVAPVPAAPPKPAPKEVRWSDAADAPAPTPRPAARPKPAPPPEPDPEPSEDHAPLRSGPAKKNRRPMVLASMVTLLVLGLVGAGGYYLVHTQRTEQRLFAEAEAAYGEGRHAEAAAKFKQLADDYPDSERKGRYDFFAALADLQAVVKAPATRDDPLPALEAFEGFVAARADSPLAKPGTGYGADVVQAGQKLAAISLDFVRNALVRYRTPSILPDDLPRPGERGPMELLDTVETVIAKTRTLLASVERFRDRDSPKSHEIAEQLDTFTTTIAAERRRGAALASWRPALDAPTNATVAEFEAAMREAGLADDAEAKAMAAAARQRLLEKVRFVAERKPAVPPPAADATGLSVAPVAGATRPPAGAAEETCFAVADGALFAFDAATGSLRWARRIAPPGAPRGTVDVPTRGLLPDGSTEAAFVVMSGGVLAARLRNGEPIWYQPLPAPAFPRPVLVGSKLFVGLRDDAGTIVAIDAATGERLGTLALHQPLGANLVALPGNRPGHGYLLAVAESLKVVVLECGGAEPLALVRSLATGHAAGAVLTDPVVLPAEEPGQPFAMVLVTAAGPSRSRLVGYRLPSAKELAAGPDTGEPPVLVAETELAGWPWFPPVADGERMAIATDTGGLRLWNASAKSPSLAALIGGPPTADELNLSRPVIALLGEDSLWAVVGGSLVRYRAALGRDGFRMVAVGKPRPVGEAVMRPQSATGANVAVVGVQPTAGGKVQVLAFDPDTGDPRWHVELATK